MEFMIVHGQYRNGPILGNGVPVLINLEKNGVTGNPIKLDAGEIEVSVDVQHAHNAFVNLKNTTPLRPLEVFINIEEDFDNSHNLPQA